MQQRSKSLRLLWLISGIALMIAGLVVGLSSHQVHQNKADTYKKNGPSANYQIATGNVTKNIYFYQSGSSEYFVALNGDFEPPISANDLANSGKISFVARTDTTSINADINGTTVTQAHPIEQIIFYDTNGQTMAIYITTEYASYISNPVLDYYQNEWPLGIVLIITGLLVDGLILLLFLAWQKPGTQPGLVGAQTGTSPQVYTQAYPAPPLYYPPQPPYPAQPGAPYPTQSGVFYPAQPGAPYPTQSGVSYPAQPGTPYPPPPRQGGRSSEQFGQTSPGQPAWPPQPQE